ncbi:hypothetical protein V2J97_26330, partial [Pseudomonas alliivorans]|nr:hypothetical protein [Pseudomonas alliivorans]
RILPLADGVILPQAKQESYFFNRIGQKQSFKPRLDQNDAPPKRSQWTVSASIDYHGLKFTITKNFCCAHWTRKRCTSALLLAWPLAATRSYWGLTVDKRVCRAKLKRG